MDTSSNGPSLPARPPRAVPERDFEGEEDRDVAAAEKASFAGTADPKFMPIRARPTAERDIPGGSENGMSPMSMSSQEDVFEEALERQAASSTASFGSAVNSPIVGSPLETYAAKYANGTGGENGFGFAVQGALVRLNHLATGEQSMDTALVEGVDEDAFKERIKRIAESQGLTVDSPSISSLVETLLPVVRELSRAEGNSDVESERSSLSNLRRTDGISSPPPDGAMQASDDAYGSDYGQVDGREDGELDEDASGDGEVRAESFNVAGGEGAPRAPLEEEPEEDLVPEAELQSAAGMRVVPRARLEEEAEEDLVPEAEYQSAAGLRVATREYREHQEESEQEEALQEDVEAAEEFLEPLKVRSEEVGGNPEITTEAAEETQEEEKEAEEAAESFMEPLKVRSEVEAEQEEDKEAEEEADSFMEPLRVRSEVEAEQEEDKEAEEEADSFMEPLRVRSEAEVEQEATASREARAETEEVQEEKEAAEGEGDSAAPQGLGMPALSKPRAEPPRAKLSEETEAAQEVEEDEESEGQYEEGEFYEEGEDGEDDEEEYGEFEDGEEEDDEEEGEEQDEVQQARAQMAAAFAAAREAAAAGQEGGRPAGGLGGGLPSLPQRPAPRDRGATANREPMAARAAPVEEEEEAVSPKVREQREKLKALKLNLIRLASRLGSNARHPMVAQVLHRIQLVEMLKAQGGMRVLNRSTMGGVAVEQLQAKAEQLEAESGPDSRLNLSLNILILGKSGVGKSATINSVLDQPLTETSPFAKTTRKPREILGTVAGVKVRFIDTPGLETASQDSWKNDRLLKQVNKFASGSRKPDIVLYVDRLDGNLRDPHSDMAILASITNAFGVSVWYNTMLVLTHAGGAPPEGANGQPISYDMFLGQRAHMFSQILGQMLQDPRINPPSIPVENHPNCRRNRENERVLPNGKVWKQDMLLLCFANKLTTEAHKILELEKTMGQQESRKLVPNMTMFLGDLGTARMPLQLPKPAESLELDLEKEEIMKRAAEIEEIYGGGEAKTAGKGKAKKVKRTKDPRAFSKTEIGYWKGLMKEFEEEEEHINPTLQDAPEAMRFKQNPAETFDATEGFTHRFRHEKQSDALYKVTVAPQIRSEYDHEHDNVLGLSFGKYDVLLNEYPVVVNGTVQSGKDGKALDVTAQTSKWHNVTHGSSAQLCAQLRGGQNIYAAHLESTLGSDSRKADFEDYDQADDDERRRKITNTVSAGGSLYYFGGTTMRGIKVIDSLQVDKLKFAATAGVLGSNNKQAGRATGLTLEAGWEESTISSIKSLTSSVGINRWRGNNKMGIGLQYYHQPNHVDYYITGVNVDNEGKGRISLRIAHNGNPWLYLAAALPAVRHLFFRIRSSMRGELQES